MTVVTDDVGNNIFLHNQMNTWLVHPQSIPINPPTANSTDDHFPNPSQFQLNDIPFLSEDLSPLEKIYLFSRSTAPFHREFIAHALVPYLQNGLVSPQEAIIYVLPLLKGLALDDGMSLLFLPSIPNHPPR